MLITQLLSSHNEHQKLDINNFPGEQSQLSWDCQWVRWGMINAILGGCTSIPRYCVTCPLLEENHLSCPNLIRWAALGWLTLTDKIMSPLTLCWSARLWFKVLILITNMASYICQQQRIFVTVESVTWYLVLMITSVRNLTRLEQNVKIMNKLSHSRNGVTFDP